MNEQQPHAVGIVIPPSVVSKGDISRLLNEAELLDQAIESAEIRAGAGSAATPPPVLSEQLEDFLSANQLQIGDAPHRSQLITCLRRLKASAPIVHITFASTADQNSLQHIVSWLRQSVHSQAVISVGLQPSLIGGAYIRTTNRVFDCSVRSQLAKSRGIIAQELEALSGSR